MVMGMTRVDEVAYITVGVGELRITNTSDGNGGLIIEWFGVRDFHHPIWKQNVVLTILLQQIFCLLPKSLEHKEAFNWIV